VRACALGNIWEIDVNQNNRHEDWFVAHGGIH
jgi:hypothetical protein